MSDHASIPSIAGDGSGETVSGHLWKRHLEIKRVDQARNDLVEELLHRYDSLNDVFKQECEDHEREREFNRRCQCKLKELGGLVQRYEGDLVQPHSSPSAANQTHTLQDLESYVLVLIDGDGLIFNNNLLLDGAAGGQRAAGLLEQYVYEYVRAEHPEIPTTVKISARVYANVKGLSETCRRASITSKTSDLHEFVVGFSQGKFLMDFVDVGAGKDRADQKVVEQLKLNLRNRHCRQILLGGSHDNGYTRILGEVVNYEQAIQKITLIEGVPFAREYGALPFRVHKFGDLFRPQKISLYDQGFPAPFPPPGLSPFQNRIQSPISTSSIVAPTDNSNMSPASAVASPTGTGTGWANVAAKAARLPAPMPQTPPMRDTSGIPRNRKGQRIDPPTSNPGIDEVTRVKRIKMCNVHFLRNECPYGNACTHVHEYKPTKAELDTLKLVARSQPCIHGTGCNDAKCIYGHRCPHPKAGKGGGSGSKNCHFFDDCKFPVEMHNMDLNVVQFHLVR
ncbi:uncharacterized protein IWZ02DRAFT_521103 [Phyllosticta citriasiana]|uniref:uncharacterized protein n=1 Tax=Phyllosticta citriasiana TaxID=595635 RepID=UPI0030FD42E1